MGKKKEGEKNKSDGGGKKDDSVLTVVLKVDMHCKGCATKIKNFVRSLEGVEAVKGGDGQLTVIGKVDPGKVREIVEQEAKSKVELVSPQPKKDKDKDKEGAGGGGGEKKSGGNPEKKPDDKKPKEKAKRKVEFVSLQPKKDKDKDKDKEGAGGGGEKKSGGNPEKQPDDKKPKELLKVSLNFDEQKNLVTVKGSMDMKVLAVLICMLVFFFLP